MTKSYFRSMLILGLLFLIIGIAMIIFQDACLQIICYAIGCIAILFGLVLLITYFARKSFLQFSLAIGIAAVLLGVLMLIRSTEVINIFGKIIGAALIVDSVFRLQIALDYKNAAGKAWLFLLICALVTLVFGILLLFVFGAKMLVVLAGVGLALDGLLIVISMLSSQKLLS